MKAWWDSLESRERLSLTALAAFLAAVFAYLLVIDPLFNGTKKIRERIATAQADVDFMQAAAPQLATGASRGGPRRAEQSPVVIVAQTMRTHQLTAKRSQPVDDNTIRVQLDAMPFDNIIRWLDQVQRENGLEIDTATIKRGDATGLADATLTLARSQPDT